MAGKFYDVDGFPAGRSTLRPFEIAEMGTLAMSQDGRATTMFRSTPMYSTSSSTTLPGRSQG